LSQSRHGHQCIETIGSQGYRFVCEVREVAGDPLLEQQAQSVGITNNAPAIQSLGHQDIQAEPAERLPTVMAQDDTTISVTAPSGARYLKLMIPALCDHITCCSIHALLKTDRIYF